ncbi:tetratricopeptide repeat-containing diguanylate cyclase [Litorilituus sediminis]|uniref:tetratricopeptide repeat-containing diguanylate cyclase n=1 Tax=Litorilituus sediminis TaxID=718192 RepID=UPI0014768417|nr:diguanylate cyclase [Litorilituus sediminis]
MFNSILNKLIVLLWLCSFMGMAQAQVTIEGVELKDYSKNIYLKPWHSYQQLVALPDTYPAMDKQTHLWWLLRKAEAEHLLYLYPQYVETVTAAEQLLVDASKDDFSSEQVISVNLFLGIYFQKESRYQEARQRLTLALEQAKAENLSYLFIRSKQELAYTLSLTEHYEASLSDMQAAYIDAFALNDEFLIATINEVYGAIYGYMQEYGKSIEYYQKALKSYQLLNYPSYTAEAYNGLAATFRYWQKYDKAIAYYKKYRQVVSQFHSGEILYFADYGLGMSYAEKGDCQQAIIVIDRALQLDGLIDYDAELLKRKAQCLIALNELEQAEQALKRASDIFAQLPELTNTRWQIEVDKIASSLAFAQGDGNKAYQLLLAYHEKNNALLEAKSSERLAKLRTNLEMERQGVESSLLKQRAKVLKLQVEQQEQKNQLQSYIIIMAGILVIFAAFVLVMQRKSHEKIQALSVIDPLSKLFNRRYIFNYLDRFLINSSGSRGSIAVLLIDIDDFKLINDRYGHPFGDYVIREVADIAQKTFRSEDVLGRIGGEEFMCILSRLDINQVMDIANRLVSQVAEHEFTDEHKQAVKVTLSIGVAQRSDTAPDSENLYAQADKALYQAKHNGKNCVIQYRQHMRHPYQSSQT